MTFILNHTRFGFCWWDIPALIILIAVIVVYAVKIRNMKEEQKELEDLLSEFGAEEAVAEEL